MAFVKSYREFSSNIHMDVFNFINSFCILLHRNLPLKKVICISRGGLEKVTAPQDRDWHGGLHFQHVGLWD